jgi:hypothetical protein
MSYSKVDPLYIDGVLCGEHAVGKTTATNPNFHSIIKSGGLLPPLPYSVSTNSSSGTPGTVNQVYGGVDHRSLTSIKKLVGGMHPAPLNLADMLSYADDKAKQSFYGNTTAYNMDVGVTLAELPKTVALIGDTALRLGGAFRHLKRGNVAGAFEAIGAASLDNVRHVKTLQKSARNMKKSVQGRDDFAANAWLEMTYGWTPLLSDIDNAAHDLALGWEANPADVFVHGSGRDERSGECHLVNSYLNNHIDFHVRTQSVRVGYSCAFSVTDKGWRTASAIGITNPLEIAWELLPYSFVVDWFVPIGDWVSSLDALLGIEFVHGSRTQKITQNLVCTSRPDSVLGDYTYEDAMHYQASQTSFQRTVIHAPPPNNFLTMAPIKKSLSVSHSITALALMQSAFSR